MPPIVASLLFAFLVAFGVLPAFAEGTLTTLLSNGPDDNRINLVVLGDGYTATEESKFQSDATSILNYMLSQQPWGEYGGLLNAYAIYVASNESGVDHPSSLIYKDTYFDGTFEVAGITRLTGISSAGYTRVFNLLAEHVPQYDIILLLFNDAQYGGSGGTIAISSTNSASPEVVLHEIGHSFGSLADEYEDYTPGYSGREDINTTAVTSRDFVKWRHWFEDTTPIPTPETSTYGDVVGLFEGACYETTGWYRPRLTCKMRTLNRVYCEVCREQLIKMEYNRLQIIENYAPTLTNLEVDDSTSVTLSLSIIEPGSVTLAVYWLIDGDTIPGENGTTLEATASLLGNGVHEVTAIVRDTTSMVRKDSQNLLVATRSWTITAISSCCGAYTAGLTGNADCSSDGKRNLSDISRLIDRVYISKLPLCCEGNGNVDGSPEGSLNLADITRLIDHVYISKIETAPCL